MSKRIIPFAISALLLFAVSCSEKPQEGGSGSSSITGNTIVKTSMNRKTVLHNPLNGWVMYLSANTDVSYFDTEFYIPELGQKVKVADYASACYIRTGWKTFNPEDGKYAWDDPNSNLCKIIEKAEELGIPIAFRVNVDGRDQRENTPTWVFDNYGAEYCYLDGSSKYPDRKTPIAMDPIWREQYEKFVEALGRRFNNPKTTAFIDGYGLGKWGEGHNVCYEAPDNPDGDNKISDKTVEYKANTMEWITSLYKRCFPDVPLVINYHRQIGHPVSSGEKAQPDSESVLAIAIKNGYCLRSDAFGMNDQGWGYNVWEKAFVANYAYKLPVIMEGGYIVSSHSYWNDPEGYRRDHPEDVRQGEYDASKTAKVNMMDFRVGSETKTWFENAFKLVQGFVSEGGYRVYPDQVSLPESVNNGADITIGHRWRNVGWGYLPNNIQQWNYKYKVAFALLDSKDEAVQVIIDEKCEPSEWISGNAFPYELKTKVNALAGDYTWAVAIVDTTDDNNPAIQLAINEKSTVENGSRNGAGWYKLLSVKVK